MLVPSITTAWVHAVMCLVYLNKKRAVSVIYNLCYCLSQACNTLQTEHALYRRSCNINQERMETQHMMGLSYAKRTLNTIAKLLSENHGKLFKHFIEDAIEHKWLLALIIDDFTSIHSKRRPQGDKAFEAKSMCTIVVKAFKNIPAISVLQVSIMHDVNGISINTCLPIGHFRITFGLFFKASPGAHLFI